MFLLIVSALTVVAAVILILRHQDGWGVAWLIAAAAAVVCYITFVLEKGR